MESIVVLLNDHLGFQVRPRQSVPGAIIIQGVYFKMLLCLPRGGVQLVEQMQSREDMEISWFIFYHLYTMELMVVGVYEKRTHL